MKVGKIDFDDRVDHDGDMEVTMSCCDDNETYEFLDREDAIQIIKHLQTYFKIPV